MILSYNWTYANRWDFSGLEAVFRLNPHVAARFFSETYPRLAQLCLSLPQQVRRPIPLLAIGAAASITLSQHQVRSPLICCPCQHIFLKIACLLANAFFCTFPRRNAADNRLPTINFNDLFASHGSAYEKMVCLLHYFHRVTTRGAYPHATFSIL